MTTNDTPLLKTPFLKFHQKHGAKLVNFAGWEMPLHYGSIIEEHHQVRNSGGIFDVSHMGRFKFSGRDCRAFLDLVCTRQVYGMQDGQARYSIICNENGGCRDDVLVYRVDENDYRMVCNAANRAKLIEHFENVKGDMVFKFEDLTMKSGMIAVQGPNVMDIISKYDDRIPQLKRYRFTIISVLGMKVMVARTGYTGEDGVEIIFPTDSFVAKSALKMLLSDLDSVAGLKPAGLGARDSLRLEAGMALYGHEIDEDLDPVSAGLDFAIRINKGEDPEKSPPEVGSFIGQEQLKHVVTDGPQRKLMGLKLEGRRAARQGMSVKVTNNTQPGLVTSGCLSPTLDQSIAMAYIPADSATPGTTVEVESGRNTIPGVICELPFYTAG